MYSYGTIHQLTCPSTFQENGRAERKLCHILDTVRALFLSIKVPASFWGEATLYVVHAINYIPSPVIQNQTPYECLFGSPSDYLHLRSFSSACFILFQPHEHNKLEPWSRLCCFLGYDPISHHLRISHNVIFWEHHSFVKLSHFRASLSSSSILDLFPDEACIPFVAAPDPPMVSLDFPIDFSIQPPNTFDPFPSSPFNEQVGRWTGLRRATQPWAWVPYYSYFAWRSCTRHSTSSLNSGKIHSYTFTWLSLLHCPYYTTQALHLSWGFHWPFMANFNERGTWCII